jgi:hypothetical protein
MKKFDIEKLRRAFEGASEIPAPRPAQAGRSLYRRPACADFLGTVRVRPQTGVRVSSSADGNSMLPM